MEQKNEKYNNCICIIDLVELILNFSDNGPTQHLIETKSEFSCSLETSRGLHN